MLINKTGSKIYVFVEGLFLGKVFVEVFFVKMVSVETVFVELFFVASIISSRIITKPSIILVKYSLFSKVQLIGFQK